MKKLNKKLNKKDMTYIAKHCNNVYPDKYEYADRSDHFKKGNITGYVIKDYGTVYIFIAGTDEFKDVITDIRLAPSRFNGESKRIKVHVGFEDAYRSIESILMDHCKNEDTVIIAGHSMGGAIATLAAYKLARTVSNVTCVTFGSPRVGNRAFAKNFNLIVPNSYRLVHGNDAITKWPKLLSWYRHVDSLYQSKGSRWYSWIPFLRLLDHSMQNYIDGIKKGMWNF